MGLDRSQVIELTFITLLNDYGFKQITNELSLHAQIGAPLFSAIDSD